MGMENPVHLSPELEQRLAEFAPHAKPEQLDHLRNAILEEIEDMVDYHLAEQAMLHIRNGTEKTVSWDEARKELGLDD